MAVGGGGGDEAGEATKEEARSTDQLLELIGFLRREKEVAIARSEVTEAETTRLTNQLEHVGRQLADAQVPHGFTTELSYWPEPSPTTAKERLRTRTFLLLGRFFIVDVIVDLRISNGSVLASRRRCTTNASAGPRRR